MTFTHALSTNNYGPAKFIVDASAANGTHTTIAAALTSASSGDTIFIRPGTYTEDLTLKAGVNLTAFGSDSSQNGTGKVIISGTCTLTAAGSVTISGIQLKTNSAALLAVTGSAASIVNLDNCYLNMTNNSGITFSSSSASAAINIKDCQGDLGTTGIGIFAHSSAGNLIILTSRFTNTGGSSTASTISAGSLSSLWSNFSNPITSSGTSIISFYQTIFDTSGQNATCFTCGGSGGGNAFFCNFASGNASSISTSVALGLFIAVINSTNTNAITGAGTLTYSSIIFSNTSSKINTTTQVGGLLNGGLTQAPSAGFIGERITNSATAVATTSSTPKTITSISLTAGIWDISGISASTATGGSATMTAVAAGISTTDNTLPATVGVDYFQLSAATATLALVTTVVPAVRATLTTTTTYYYVVNNVYSSTTCPTNARISATRVG